MNRESGFHVEVEIYTDPDSKGKWAKFIIAINVLRISASMCTVRTRRYLVLLRRERVL